MRKALSTFGTLGIAALAAALIGLATPKPAAAAPLSTGAAITLDAANTGLTEQVQYRRGHRRGGYYGHRRGFYGHRYRPVYRYRAPIYYGRRCWTQPRMVMTPWGWQRRYVRVCR
jgi:hypothetical protein